MLLSCAFSTVCVMLLVLSLFVSCFILVNVSSGTKSYFPLPVFVFFFTFPDCRLVSAASRQPDLPCVFQSFPLFVSSSVLFFVFLDSCLCSPRASGLYFFWVFVFVFGSFCVSPQSVFVSFVACFLDFWGFYGSQLTLLKLTLCPVSCLPHCVPPLGSLCSMVCVYIPPHT